MPTPLHEAGKETRQPASPTDIVHQARHRADLPAFTDALNSHFASIQQVGTDQGFETLCSAMEAAIQRLGVAAAAYAKENARLREELAAVKAALNVARLPERTQHPSTGVALTQLQDAMRNATMAQKHPQVVPQLAQPVQQLESVQDEDAGNHEEPELPEPQQQAELSPHEEEAPAEAEEKTSEEEGAEEQEQDDVVRHRLEDSTTSDRVEKCSDDTERRRGSRGEFSGATFLLTATLVSVAYAVTRRSSLFR